MKYKGKEMTYCDKKRLGQVGEYDTLIFYGVQQDYTLIGEWLYQNYRYNSNYSGPMWMIYN